jgi:hypothetical protein
MHRSIMGIVDTDVEAQSILGDLRRIGFQARDISVLASSAQGPHKFAYRPSSKAPERALLGVGVGAALGAGLALLASFGQLTVPGVQHMLAAGPLIAALSGGATGAALGCVAGALRGLRIPEIEAMRCDDKLACGNILIAVHVASRDAERITESVLTRGGAHDIVTAHDAR